VPETAKQIHRNPPGVSALEQVSGSRLRHVSPEATRASENNNNTPKYMHKTLRLLAISALGVLAAVRQSPAESRTVSPGPILSLSLSNQTPVVLLAASPGARCVVEFSADLRLWTPLSTNLVARHPVAVVDRFAGDASKRFYRAVVIEELGYVPGEMLLRWKPTATLAEADEACLMVPMEFQEEILTRAMSESGADGIMLVTTEEPVEEVAAFLREQPAVDFAEPNWVVRCDAVPNDPLYRNATLWGMYGDSSQPANSFGSQAAEAWAAGYTGSRSVVVGIIDAGMDISHPDLAANIWRNPFEIPNNGRDDDGNGYVDDVNGWDFFNNDKTVFDGALENSHGTHVAGTIGAVGNNGIGVAGANWQVSMISGKFLGPLGMGTLDNAIKAVDYFTDLKRRHGINIVALNNSWGGGNYSQALHEAILRAAKANILFVAAAGNEAWDNDLAPRYPAGYDTTVRTSGEAAASYDAVISVAAIAADGSLAAFSNTGSRSVDIAAPGVGVVSCLPGSAYGSMNGTSMATPHVTGALALYYSTHPGVSPQHARAALLNAAQPTPSLTGKCATQGRLDLSTVIGPPAGSPPAAPSGLAVALNEPNRVQLRWSDNSANELAFGVQRSVDGINFTTIGTVGPSATSYSDPTVLAGVRYWYRVFAQSMYGDSHFSNSADVTPPVGETYGGRLIYVDASYQGATQNGSSTRPYRTLVRAYSAAKSGDRISVRAGSYPETLSLTKRIRLEAEGGVARLGAR
jgi:subtilisin family serine protease